MTYLDWNATTPPHPEVLAAMEAARPTAWANPASVHGEGRAARRVLEDTRELLASVLKLSPRDVVFTGGGTEANHLALAGASCILLSRLEHPSVWEQARAQGLFAKIPVLELPCLPAGHLDPEQLRLVLQEAQAGGKLGERPVLAMQAANQETGVLQPIEAVGTLCAEFGVHFHVDAVQVMGRGNLEALSAAGSIAVTAHKHRGPKGIGALAYRCGFVPQPLGRGGKQERGMRPGTQDAVAAAGWAAALRRLDESRGAYERTRVLRDRLEAALREDVVIHGRDAERLPHVSCFSVPGWGGDEVVAHFDLMGVCISSGSACSSGTSEPSPVIEAMAGRELARRAVRISFGEESTEGDLEALLEALDTILLLKTSR